MLLCIDPYTKPGFVQSKPAREGEADTDVRLIFVQFLLEPIRRLPSTIVQPRFSAAFLLA
jgi:hypothetical protein